MKRKLLPKSLFLAFAVFSLSAFAFVNLHANLTLPQQSCSQTLVEQPQVQECDEETSKTPLPDVTVLGRVLELAQKFLPVAN